MLLYNIMVVCGTPIGIASVRAFSIQLDFKKKIADGPDSSINTENHHILIFDY